jgi:hypothetical protein
MSGSIKVRSWSRSSLQQMPPSCALLAHLAAGGVSTPGSELSIGHTGGFFCFTEVFGRDGRGRGADMTVKR